MTPHQCWNVCDWETTGKDQPSEAQLSLRNAHSKIQKTIFRQWRNTSSSQPSKLFTQTRWLRRRDGAPTFQKPTQLRWRGPACLGESLPIEQHVLVSCTHLLYLNTPRHCAHATNTTPHSQLTTHTHTLPSKPGQHCHRIDYLARHNWRRT